jgi:hypothetical protein
MCARSMQHDLSLGGACTGSATELSVTDEGHIQAVMCQHALLRSGCPSQYCAMLGILLQSILEPFEQWRIVAH